jgi:hypothetical protein
VVTGIFSFASLNFINEKIGTIFQCMFYRHLQYFVLVQISAGVMHILSPIWPSISLEFMEQKKIKVWFLHIESI